MVRRRLRSWLWRVPVEQEVREELALHVELRTRTLVDEGMSPAVARAEAERRLGDPARIQAAMHRIGHDRNRRWALADWVSAWRRTYDSPHARRGGSRASPRPRSSPWPSASPPRPPSSASCTPWSSPPSRLRNPTVCSRCTPPARTAGATRRSGTSTISGSARRPSTRWPRHTWSASTSRTRRSRSGCRPWKRRGRRSRSSASRRSGRTFGADEDQPGRHRVAVLTEGLWRRRFGADPTIVGRRVRLNSEPFEVIGVMPAAFDAVAYGADLVIPTAFTPERLAMHDEHFLDLFGRRRAGVTMAQVNGELARIAEGLRRDFPKDNLERGAEAERLDAEIIGNYRQRLFVLLAAVVLVLVIACGNAANLLLARLAARSQELAVRAAIGAGRWRIVRQILAESLFLSTLAAVAGLALASWLLPILVASAPDGIPRLENASLSAPVLGMAVLAALATTVIVGALPAWYATGGDLRGDLVEGRGRGPAIRPWVRQALLAAQAMLVLMVLAGAALLIRSAINLQQMPLGFDTADVLRARVGLPAAEYRTSAVVRGTFEDLLARVTAAPGVGAAALNSQAPLGGGRSSNGIIPEGRPIGPESIILSRSNFISPGYFRVMRMPLVAGRAFEASDIRSSPLVMVINETLAREAFPGGDALGKRMVCCEGSPDDPRWKIVVGVVADVRSSGPAGDVRPEFYLPIAQIPDVAWAWVSNTMDVMARPASGSPAAMAGVIRTAVRDIDPALPVYAVRTLDEGVREATAQARFNMWLMTLLGIVGLGLAALGIYSVIAWLVEQRTREIGVRLALGAPPGSVVRLMVAHGLVPVAAGLAVGLVGAVLAGRLLQGQLFQVRAGDPATLAATAALLLAVATLAAAIPAWRATGIDPARALHDT
ncbi:MAG: ADOP family duplicated permease [Vicinamibacterales bacterium]